MLVLIACLIGGCAYFLCPLPLQLVLTAINFFVPDPILFLDEIIMVGGILAKLYWLDDFITDVQLFLHRNKWKILAVILAVAAISGGAYWYYCVPKG